MHELIFIQVVPDDLYFQWQIEVQIVNFRKFEISKNMEILICHRNNPDNLKAWKKIQEKYPEVKFFFYKNDSPHIGLYIPVLRPHTLKKHKFNKKVVYFYHDSDIIFNYLPDFDKLIKGNICWQSDCSSYLDYDYLRTKEIQGNIPEHEAIQKLADIGCIPIEIIQSYNKKTGGAQTILRNLDAAFWEDVERMCVEIRKTFSFGQEGSVNTKYFSSEVEGFQSWCADMWALNFAQWRKGMVTNVTKELDFSWATDNIDTYNKKPIFHNAGATRGGPIFYKGEWINKSPIGQDLPLPADDSASRKYVEAILEVNI